MTDTERLYQLVVEKFRSGNGVEVERVTITLRDLESIDVKLPVDLRTAKNIARLTELGDHHGT